MICDVLFIRVILLNIKTIFEYIILTFQLLKIYF